MSKWRPSLIDAPVCCALLCVGFPPVETCDRTADTLARNAHCILCNRRLSLVRHTHPHGAGRACHPRCKALNRAAGDAQAAVQGESAGSALPSSAAAGERPKKRTRRAHSDPGEEEEVQTDTRLRTRTYAVKKEPPPVQTTRKNPPSLPPPSSSSLDETHARRLAFLASAAASSSSSPSSSSHQNVK
jgi:hypothetical protein